GDGLSGADQAERSAKGAVARSDRAGLALGCTANARGTDQPLAGADVSVPHAVNDAASVVNRSRAERDSSGRIDDAGSVVYGYGISRMMPISAAVWAAPPAGLRTGW